MSLLSVDTPEWLETHLGRRLVAGSNGPRLPQALAAGGQRMRYRARATQIAGSVLLLTAGCRVVLCGSRASTGIPERAL
jgi:hypothetical protein